MVQAEVLACPVLIESNAFNGSGFQVNTGAAIYLVSARHVLFKAGLETILDPVKITTLTGKKLDTPAVHFLDCPSLRDAGHLAGHPDRNVDIAACKIANVKAKASNSRSFNMTVIDGVREHDPDHDKDLFGVAANECVLLSDALLGEEIYFVGYPTSLAKDKHHLLPHGYPLIRSGIIAGKPPGGRIIIDCATFPGNSGGLVLRTRDSRAIGLATHNIGFTEKYYSSVDRREVGQQRHNSGYTVVEPMDRVLEAIQEVDRLSKT